LEAAIIIIGSYTESGNAGDVCPVDDFLYLRGLSSRITITISRQNAPLFQPSPTNFGIGGVIAGAGKYFLNHEVLEIGFPFTDPQQRAMR